MVVLLRGFQSIPVRPRGSSDAFGPFRYAVEVVMVVLVPIVHNRAPWLESGPGSRRVRSDAFGPFPSALWVVGCVQSIPVRAKCCRVPSCAFGPYLLALEFVLFI